MVNLSSRPLTDEEFRPLGKELKFCPKPKPHDTVKLAEEAFKFSRRIRLKEYFAPDSEDDESNDLDREEEKIPKEKRNRHLSFLLQDVIVALISI